ncbi:MAG: aminotransferase class V-fold PLP-dependent enzyme [Vicinamibacterales bacterium]
MSSPVSTVVDPVFAAIRSREFARLDARGQAYLDYTGSALYGVTQVRRHQQLLEQGIYGNPHSTHEPSCASTDVMVAARRRVLRFFDVDESTHEVCFTANASAASKLVAESYPFAPDRGLVLAADNHNSVLGTREFARRAGAPVTVLPLDEALRLGPETAKRIDEARTPGGGLLAYPAQSNFTGVVHPQSLVGAARERGWDVLLDIAAFAPSHPFSLRACPADFVIVSFYKLFGYPTGLGALVARRESLARLRRPWFAGGTVLFVSVQAERHQLKAGAEAFEDGTPSFLAVSALDAGFDLLEEVGMTRLQAHVERLSARLLGGMRALRHANGRPVVRVYGPPDMTDRGGAIAFNLLDPDGGLVSYEDGELAASRAGVSFRGGCFCNPGAAEAAFHFDPETTARCFDQLAADFSIPAFGACIGSDKEVGALRASVGLANNDQDIDRALAVLTSYRR